MVQITAPSCQFYEASGPDAVRAIDSLRAGCVDRAGISAKVVGSCPTVESLGGCKTPIAVKGGANVTLFVTTFFYKASGDASSFGSPLTAAAVEQECAAEKGGVHVPAP